MNFIKITIALALCVCFVAAEDKYSLYNKPVTGFVDTHVHQMAEFAYGGGWLYGKHDGSEEEALKRCSGLNDHGFLAGEGFLGIHLQRRNGYSKFEGWPHWDSISHQQVYWKWLRKAHEDGLNVIVMSAVNFEPLAQLIPKKHRVEEWGYEDIPAIKRQLEASHKFVETHKEWCEIALTPFEARRIIHEGKLAIILAIETSDPFGKEDLHKQLNEYYDLGVRSLQINHQLNNRFAGAAPHHKLFYIFQFIRDIVGDPKGAKEDAKEALFSALATQHKVRSSQELDPETRRIADEMIERGFGFEFDENGKNVEGLTEEGKVLIQEMMNKKMLIDIAHLSERSVRGVYEIAQKNSYYPLYLSHGHIRAIMPEEKAKEEKTTPLEFFPYIMKTGGVFGLRTGKDETLTYKHSGIDNCCSGTSRSFAQMYQFAVKELKLRVALASDLNGFITQIKPRFAPHHNSPEEEKNCPDNGQRWSKGVGSDYDTKGFAHIGLIYDIMKDLKKQGVDSAPIDRSAEEFLQMWERAYDENRQELPYDVDLEKVLETIEK